ncbi:25800_t:CDS:2 [Gigaspora rosea]|nr:25800_t:CDS:2 [Gigaspora rosea]
MSIDSFSAPSQKSVRVVRQDTLVGATDNLRISSGSGYSSCSSNGLKDLHYSASKFTVHRRRYEDTKRDLQISFQQEQSYT